MTIRCPSPITTTVKCSTSTEDKHLWYAFPNLPPCAARRAPLTCRVDRWQASLWTLLALGGLFAITSLDAAGACYVVPCVPGDMSLLYRVSTGSSFQLVLSGLLFVAQPVYGIFLLKARCSEHVAGGFIAASCCTTLLALVNACVSGSTRAMLIELEAMHGATANQVRRAPAR